jgi:hypothetical protein
MPATDSPAAIHSAVPKPSTKSCGGAAAAVAREHRGEHGYAEHAAQLAQRAIGARGDAGVVWVDRALTKTTGRAWSTT